MSTIELMCSIGQVDDNFIIETFETTTRNNGINRKILIVALAAAVALLAGCAAAYILHHTQMAETLFGINGRASFASDTVWRIYEPGGERTELNKTLAGKYLEPYIIPAEGTLRDGDTTLTVLSYIVDRTSCTSAVYLKFENPPEYEVYNSGRLLFKTEHAKDSWYIHPRATGQNDMIGRFLIDEASTTETELYCVLMFSCEPEATELTLRIKDLPEKIVLNLPEQTAIPSISLKDGDIQISALGMKIPASILKQDENTKHPKDYHTGLAIRFKDGSEYMIQHDENIGYTYAMALNTSCEDYVVLFNRIIEVGNVEALRLNSHVYTVS